MSWEETLEFQTVNQFEKQMRIFATENMMRQYKIDGLPYDADLCFFVHKLIVEVYEDGHVYYLEEKHQIRQKLIENLGFTLIRINLDVENLIKMLNLQEYITTLKNHM